MGLALLPDARVYEEKGIQIGIEQGIKQGIQEGIQREKIETVLRLKSLGLNIEQIASNTVINNIAATLKIQEQNNIDIMMKAINNVDS